MSNSQSNVVYDREFFALICDNLVERRGARRVGDRFQSLLALASLPWLDQPRFLEPGRLIFEIHDTWDALWTLQVRDIVGGAPAERLKRARRARNSKGNPGDETFGRYLARPLHELAVFAASGGSEALLRVGTHRRLIVEPERWSGLRVIRGGAAE